ncbi:MAG: hypothetical protein MK089_04865 [Phycisphaerales bacterium]|nr:hypothetical protein [Phycisphaerales bacterium]
MDQPLTGIALESEIWLILAGVSGAMLLLIGGRIIKLGLLLGGLAAGSLAGWLIWLTLELPMPGWVALGLGALVALFLSLILVRLAAAVLFGVILASFLCGLVMTVASFDGELAQRPIPVPTMVANLVSIELPADTPADQAAAAEMIRAKIQASWEDLKQVWAAVAAEYKLALIIASLSGLGLGLLIGAIALQFSLPAIASLWGGLLVLASLIGLFGTNEGPWQSNLAMMTAWGVLSAVGWSIQRTKPGKPAVEGD